MHPIYRLAIGSYCQICGLFSLRVHLCEEVVWLEMGPFCNVLHHPLSDDTWPEIKRANTNICIFIQTQWQRQRQRQPTICTTTFLTTWCDKTMLKTRQDYTKFKGCECARAKTLHNFDLREILVSEFKRCGEKLLNLKDVEGNFKT